MFGTAVSESVVVCVILAHHLPVELKQGVRVVSIEIAGKAASKASQLCSRGGRCKYHRFIEEMRHFDEPHVAQKWDVRLAERRH